MGGEYGPLGRRQSGKGRAVPVRCPSIVRSSSCTVCVVFCSCPALQIERIVQSWSSRYVSVEQELGWNNRSETVGKDIMHCSRMLRLCTIPTALLLFMGVARRQVPATPDTAFGLPGNEPLD